MRKYLILIGLLLTIGLSGQLPGVVASQTAGGKTYLTVLNDGNTIGWYIATADNLTLSGVDVTTWDDETTNNHDVTHATAGNKPHWDSANGEVDFNDDAGTDDFLSFTEAQNQPFTIYCVIRQNARTNLQNIIQFNNVAGGAIQQSSSDANITLFAGSYLANTNAALSTYAVVTAVVNGNSSNIVWNETSKTGAGGTNAMTHIRIGGQTSAQFSVKEVIHRIGADSDEDRLLIIRGLNTKYTIY